MFKTRRGTRSHRAQQTNNVRADDPVRPQNQNAITLIALVITIIVLARNIDLTDKKGKKIDISNYTEIVFDEIYEKKLVKSDASVILAVVSIEGKIMTMKAKGTVSFTITQQDCYNILNIITYST